MYKNPVRRATDNLDGQRPIFLHGARMENAGTRLKAIREALPKKAGVREIARALGYDKSFKYGYYESAGFKKDVLPFDKAKEFAAVFRQYGGDPAEVLALAGLSGDDQVRESAALPDPAPQLIYAMMPVAFPSEEALTRMFETILEKLAPPDLVDVLAQNLALRLPTALAQASASPPVPVRDASTADAADARPRAKPRQPRRPEQHT
ncbi:hypothetical protein [Rhizorhabdus sp.]|jgi:hypothetical protein|uniref:hypothetical protein n=1 Tax=Rhizorhabdus sp. TaxID=1968843 RepID=UPI0019B08177|nr:hypothetical protein [Rhizorhabdus sp.]MBD3762614.1 hypothetical protein [Rhizorhabdus sp.]